MKISTKIRSALASFLIITTAAGAFTAVSQPAFAQEMNETKAGEADLVVTEGGSGEKAEDSAEETGKEEEKKELYIPNAPDVYSGSAILMDADTGAILMEKNAYERNYPASTTKILTGLIVTANTALSEKIVFSEAAAGSVEEGDASLHTKAGEEYTIDEALHGLLLHSANEIAYGLAEYVAGSIDAFADMMNKAAEDAGALDTHFANPSGLYDDEHYTTAYDMALIARECFNNPTFLAIDSGTYGQIPATNMTDTARSFSNRNLLLPGMKYEYAYCVGGKTGYVPEGGYTYVSYAQKDGMRLIAVCFQSGADERFSDARNMFEWGFNNFSKVSLTGSPITAPYSNTSYLNSGRFNSGSIEHNLNVSYITLPDGADVSDVNIGPDPNHPTTAGDEKVNVPIAFTYGDFTAGTADLNYTRSDAVTTANPMLPSLKQDAEGENKQKAAVNKPFVVDLKILIGIGLGLLGVFIIWAIVSGVRRRRERNALYKSRRRSF